MSPHAHQGPSRDQIQNASSELRKPLQASTLHLGQRGLSSRPVFAPQWCFPSCPSELTTSQVLGQILEAQLTSLQKAAHVMQSRLS